jgi:hypothetical protein
MTAQHGFAPFPESIPPRGYPAGGRWRGAGGGAAVPWPGAVFALPDTTRISERAE